MSGTTYVARLGQFQPVIPRRRRCLLWPLGAKIPSDGSVYEELERGVLLRKGER
jgi:hypothetical protein